MKKELYGITEIRVSSACKGKALDITLKKGLTLLDSKIDDNSELIILTAKKDASLYLKHFEENGVEVISVTNHGERLRHIIRQRLGVLFGAVLLLFGLYFSSKLVWSIEIHGNERLSDNEVREILKSSGLFEGTYIPKIKYDSLHNSILLSTKEIAWVSVNIRGNRALVELTETREEQAGIENNYCNIVASQDGQIASVFVFSGKKCVSIGDVVKKGDILISGVRNSQSSGVRYESADGIIKAYVNKHLEIEIPMIQQSKEYSQRIHAEKHLKIFNKDITFFTKYNKCGEFCDTIEKKSSKLSLPIYFYTIEHHPWSLSEVKITAEEAAALATDELNKRLDLISQNAEIITKSVKTQAFDGKVKLICDLYCLESICQRVEFEVKN